MFKAPLLTAACTVLFLSAGAFYAPSNAASNSGYMQACSAQWQAMKTAGTVPVGMKWPAYLKTCNAAPKPQATNVVQNPAFVAPVVGQSSKIEQTVATTPIQAPAGQTFMQACSAEWQAMKSAGTIPAGMKWTSFLKTCNASAATPQTDVQTNPVPAATAALQSARKQAVTPAYQPAPAAQSATYTSPVGPTATGRVPSQGQLAEQSRIKECGSEWKTAKANNAIPTGQSWPQFWSACDARLKGSQG